MAIDSNNLSRALDVATHLKSEKAMKAARQLVVVAQQPQLLERFDLLVKAMFPNSVEPSTLASESANPDTGSVSVPSSEPQPARSSTETVIVRQSPIPAQPPISSSTQSMKPGDNDESSMR